MIKYLLLLIYVIKFYRVMIVLTSFLDNHFLSVLTLALFTPTLFLSHRSLSHRISLTFSLSLAFPITISLSVLPSLSLSLSLFPVSLICSPPPSHLHIILWMLSKFWGTTTDVPSYDKHLLWLCNVWVALQPAQKKAESLVRETYCSHF